MMAKNPVCQHNGYAVALVSQEICYSCVAGFCASMHMFAYNGRTTRAGSSLGASLKRNRIWQDRAAHVAVRFVARFRTALFHLSGSDFRHV